MDDDIARWFVRETRPRPMFRAVLTGGPFDGEEAFLIPPDTAVPVQIVWSGWIDGRFDAWLYEYNGERAGDPIDRLIYRPTGRRINPDSIPYAVYEAAEIWATSTAMLVNCFEVPAELIWPGV